MTQRFILDENVMIYAQLGENESGDVDATCMRLVEQIIEICHTIIIDPNLWNKYFHQLNQPRYTHPQAGFRLLKVLANAIRMAGKVNVRQTNAEPFPEENEIPAGSLDDTEIVRLAVETRATLVTTDAPLRNDLNSCGIQEIYNLDILSPDEALKIL